ncbi:MAG: hypothetical protein RIR24_597 [Actinomycetota bacterium]
MSPDNAQTKKTRSYRVFCALGGTRTPNLLIRSQMLYPLSYKRRVNLDSSLLENQASRGALPLVGEAVALGNFLTLPTLGLEVNRCLRRFQLDLAESRGFEPPKDFRSLPH